MVVGFGTLDLQKLIYMSIIQLNSIYIDVYIMKLLSELGVTVATRRRAQGLKQADVARKAGITPESLSRFERGHMTDMGARKLLAVLAVLGMELQFAESGQAGSLDELRKERGGK